MRNTTKTGLAAIVLGIGFNVPYAMLASLYDYPQILRQPAAEALERFAAGGPTFVLAWYGFMLAALALIPVSLTLALTAKRLADHPALSIGATISGALAGLIQAIGLARWVFVVPSLAAHPASQPAQMAFDLLNAYGGVAIGEHIGQLLTAMFVVQMGALQKTEGNHLLAHFAKLTASLLILGTGEGVALALGIDRSGFSLATIAGFFGLSVWLIITGGVMLGTQRRLQFANRPREAWD